MDSWTVPQRLRLCVILVADMHMCRLFLHVHVQVSGEGDFLFVSGVV